MEESYMESVLTDLELDLREIKYLLEITSREPDSMLQQVAKRRIIQMQSHLNVLLQGMEKIITEGKNNKDIVITEETIQPVVQSEPDMESVVEIPVSHEKKVFLKEILPEEVTDTSLVPLEKNGELIDLAVESTEEITELHSPQLESWGDRLKPAKDLKSSLTLNDRFLYSRELFHSDMEQMDNVLQQISQMETLENVLSFLESVLDVDAENGTYQDFAERIKKYFY